MWGCTMQGCMQICLQAGKAREAGLFLKDRCAELREAFDFSTLLLKPAGPDAPETGATIAWCDPSSILQCHDVHD